MLAVRALAPRRRRPRRRRGRCRPAAGTAARTWRGSCRCDSESSGRDAVERGAGAAIVAVAVAQRAGLRRTARRVVLGIEVEDDRLPAQRGQRHRLALVALEREVGCLVTGLQHRSSSERNPRSREPADRRASWPAARPGADSLWPCWKPTWPSVASSSPSTSSWASGACWTWRRERPVFRATEPVARALAYARVPARRVRPLPAGRRVSCPHRAPLRVRASARPPPSCSAIPPVPPTAGATCCNSRSSLSSSQGSVRAPS